jgi:hypothetical protein
MLNMEGALKRNAYGIHQGIYIWLDEWQGRLPQAGSERVFASDG